MFNITCWKVSLGFNWLSTLVNTTTISLLNFDSSCAAPQAWDIGTVAWRLRINFAQCAQFLLIHIIISIGYDQPTHMTLRCQELELHWIVCYKIGCWCIHNIDVVCNSRIPSLPGLPQRVFNFNGLLARPPAYLRRAFMVTELSYYLFFLFHYVKPSVNQIRAW